MLFCVHFSYRPCSDKFTLLATYVSTYNRFRLWLLLTGRSWTILDRSRNVSLFSLVCHAVLKILPQTFLSPFWKPSTECSTGHAEDDRRCALWYQNTVQACQQAYISCGFINYLGVYKRCTSCTQTTAKICQVTQN